MIQNKLRRKVTMYQKGEGQVQLKEGQGQKKASQRRDSQDQRRDQIQTKSLSQDHKIDQLKSQGKDQKTGP